MAFYFKSPLQGDLSFLSADISKIGASKDLMFLKPINNLLRDSPKMALSGENSIIAVSPTATVNTQVLGSILGGLGGELDSDGGNDVVEYIVQEGDKLSSIALSYGISTETILLANNLTSKSKISVGQKLIILPVTGVLYHIKDGDTLSQIARDYKGKVSEIVEINSLANENDIFIGDILIIPGGKIPAKKASSTPSQIPIGASSLLCPTASCRISQGLHYYNAIDFSGECGEPIYASASGTVQRAVYGWNGGAGNYVRIIHPNGVVTMYGHLQSISVSPGDLVGKGRVIGKMGGKPGTPGAGISTGCHVHFDVRGSKNPFSK